MEVQAIPPPAPARPPRLALLLAGTGLTVLGWIATVALMFAILAYADGHGLDLDRFRSSPDGVWMALPLLPGTAYLIWRAARGRQQALHYAIFGIAAGYVLPFVVLIGFFLVVGVPHA
jgi:hypothetical protein